MLPVIRGLTIQVCDCCHEMTQKLLMGELGHYLTISSVRFQFHMDIFLTNLGSILALLWETMKVSDKP